MFRIERTTPSEALRVVESTIPKGVRTKCSWAFRGLSASTLPEGYCIPKGKKGFTSARCVIAFGGHVLAKLHRAVGQVLAEISELVFSELTFNATTTVGAIECLKLFQQRLQAINVDNPTAAHDWAVELFNEDLKGFFPSVPQERLIIDAERLLERFLRTRPIHTYGEPFVFTVFLREPKRRVVVGRVRDPGSVSIPYDLVVPILKHAQLASVFECAGKVVRQIRGAFIGSSLFTAWCTVSVMTREAEWHEANGHLFSSMGRTWAATRYVDNRMLVVLKSKHSGLLIMAPSKL